MERLEEYLSASNQAKESLDDTIEDISAKFSNLVVSNGKSYLRGDHPTKTDNDVYEAFKTSRLKQKLLKYPNINNWYKRISHYSESVRVKWPRPRSRSEGENKENKSSVLLSPIIPNKRENFTRHNNHSDIRKQLFLPN